jgi:hypothetical protein
MALNWGTNKVQVPERSVNYEAWNRYVLMAIGLFAVLLYAGLLYAGIAEFRSRLALRDKSSRRWRNRFASSNCEIAESQGIDTKKGLTKESWASTKRQSRRL